MDSHDRFDRENTIRVSLKLNKRTDADIIRVLEKADSKQGFIKRCIRDYIKEDAK